MSDANASGSAVDASGPVAAAHDVGSGLIIERRRAADLKFDPQNARSHGVKNLAAIRASLEKFGQRVPLVIRPDGTVVSGNGTLSQLRDIGAEFVDVVVFEGGDEEARALAIAMNRTAELAKWDDGALGKALSSLSDDLRAAAGFVGAGLSRAMRVLSSAVVEDDAPEVQESAVTRAGDVWLFAGSDHRLRCGDATDFEDVRALLAGAAPELMVTDPPYGVEYDPGWRTEEWLDEFGAQNKNKAKLGRVLNDDRADWYDAWRHFPGSVAYVYHAATRSPEVYGSLQRANFAIRAQIIWAKDRLAMSRGDYHWQHEPCWYAVRGGRPGLRTDDRSQSTLWTIPARDDAGHGHGTQKPVECMARPMRNHTIDEVYDPFLGSGTTLIAAEQLGRRCFGMELSPNYVDVAVRRWQALTGRTAVLDGDGRTFDEVAAARAAEIAAPPPIFQEGAEKHG